MLLMMMVKHQDDDDNNKNDDDNDVDDNVGDDDDDDDYDDDNVVVVDDDDDATDHDEDVDSAIPLLHQIAQSPLIQLHSCHQAIMAEMGNQASINQMGGKETELLMSPIIPQQGAHIHISPTT